MKPYVSQAAGILAMMARQEGKLKRAFDPAVWLPFILAILDKLVGCKPDPADGFRYLTWKPFWLFDPFGWRLEDHRRKLSAKMLWAWDGTADEARVAVATVWAAIDAGKVNEVGMYGLYRDALGK